jgi:exodeoxyribonuclease V alpha subunit
MQAPNDDFGDDSQNGSNDATYKDALVLTEEQESAVNLALREPVSCITGGAGVGKTTVLRALVERVQAMGNGCLLLAPTGKAAARIAEKTLHHASTIHRALGWDFETESPKFDAMSPWPQKQVAVDESSMIDAQLGASLFGAARIDGRITLVGDPYQLPPVGPGALFADLLRSGKIPTARLKTIHRQGAGSPVIAAAHAVLRGRLPETRKGPIDGFAFVPAENEDHLMGLALSIVRKGLPNRYELATDADIQVLTPTRAMAEDLNDALARHWNPSAGLFLGAGDKVIHLKNNYDLGVFNGDVGRCLTRDDQGNAQVEYDGRVGTLKLALHNA